MKISRQSSVKVISSLVLAFSIFSCSINQINVPTTTPNYKNKSDINSFKIKYSSDFNPKAYYLAFDDVRQAIKNKQIPDVFYHYVFTQSSEPQRLTDSNYLTIKNRIESGEWSEEAYLMANPDIISLISSGTYKSGYDHWYNYAQINEPNRITSQEYLDAKSAIDSGFNEKAYRLAWSDIDLAIKNGTLFNSYTHYNLIAKYIEPWRLTDANYLKIKSAIENGFDEKAYLLANSDVKSVVDSGYYKTGLEHYLIYGVNENRLESSSYQDAKLALLLDFDETRYRMAFPDVDIAIKSGSFTSAFHHFYTFGKYENKLLDSKYINTKSAIELGFQENAYLLANPDVKNVVISGYHKTGLEHYLIYGANEHRLESSTYQAAKLALSLDFDETRYRMAFPDVDNAIKNGSFTSAFHHFYTFGKYENRLKKDVYIDTKYPEMRVNNYTSGYQGAQSVGMDSSGNYVIVWEGSGNGDSDGIFGQKFSNNGDPIGSEFKINTYTINKQYNPKIAMNESGNFVVTWVSTLQDGSYDGIYAQRYNSLGQFVGNEFRVNDYTTNSQKSPAIAINNSGEFIITWERYNFIEPTLDSFQLEPFQPIDSYTNNKTNIYAKKYDSFGQAIDSEFLVNNNNNYPENIKDSEKVPSVGIDGGGNFVVTWINIRNEYTNPEYETNMPKLINSYTSINAKKFNSNLNPIGEKFQVNSNISTTTNYLSDVWRLGKPTIAMNSLGNFVISWNYGDLSFYGTNVYVKKYASTLQVLKDEFKVSVYDIYSRGEQQISIDNNDNFIISWFATDGFSNVFGSKLTPFAIFADGYSPPPPQGYGAYAKRFNSSGNALESEFRVKAFTTDIVINPQIAMSNINNFIVTWTNKNTSDIYSKSYFLNK
ncbi:MAG: hypothetical protein U0354_04805 [Candidatus Sericytochromatia bacterium]